MTKCRSIANRNRFGFTLVEIMIVVLIISILFSIDVPNFVTARNSSRARACIQNLKEIDSAKTQWIMNNRAVSNYLFTADSNSAMPDFVPTYIRKLPACPGGGTYTVSDGTTNPTCNYVMHGTYDIPHTLT